MMDRHVLIAVSTDKSSLSGVRFVSDFFSDKTRVKATLFYSAPKPPAVFENEKSLEADSRQKEQQRKILKKGKDALEKARQECLDLGFKKENIDQTLQPQVFSKAVDIIQQGEKGAYDAVVLGRRGLTMLEELFEDSVSRAVFKETFTFPLWLCRTSDPARKNILLFVDGSAASFQMADHVGFVLALEKRHNVTILALEKISDQSSLMDQYKETLLKHGISGDMVQTQILESGNPANQILKMVEQESYAAVALGRSSSESNLLSRLFKGPVCSILFKELNDAALWICP